jgi:hypothetical protein
LKYSWLKSRGLKLGVEKSGVKMSFNQFFDLLKKLFIKCYENAFIKGQLISKCHRFDQNSNENIVRISALKFFVASWGLPGSFLGLSGDLVNSIVNKEAYRKPQKASRKL